MRYRANTRLKGAPKHRGSMPFTEARIQRTAEVLAAWSEANPLPWSERSPLMQQSWLAEAESHLTRKLKGTPSSCVCCL